MSSDGRPAIRGRRLGTALRKYRESLRFDLKDAAEAVGCSTSKISRLESGLSPARVGDVRILLDLYQIQDAELRARLESLARQSNKRGWWADYQATVKDGFTDFVTLEADASFIRITPNTSATQMFSSGRDGSKPPRSSATSASTPPSMSRSTTRLSS